MLYLHPLRLIAADDNKYRFLFRTERGESEYIFPLWKKGDGPWSMDSAGLEYGNLTSSDISGLLIAKCVFRFNNSRLEEPTGRFIPSLLQYLGEGPDLTFNYLVEGSRNSEKERILVKVTRDVEATKSKLESSLGIFDSFMGIHGYLLLSDQDQDYANLMQSVLFFDTARDFKLDMSLPVFRVDMRFEGVF